MDRLNEYVEAQKFLETLDWDGIPNSDEPLATICDALQEIQKYKYLEEQGLLLRKPCKVGDTIYVNGVLGVGEAEEYKVIRVDYHSNPSTGKSEFYIEALLVSNPRSFIGFFDKEFGKTVFLTKAEAEQRLKEKEQAYE